MDITKTRNLKIYINLSIKAVGILLLLLFILCSCSNNVKQQDKAELSATFSSDNMVKPVTPSNASNTDNRGEAIDENTINKNNVIPSDSTSSKNEPKQNESTIPSNSTVTNNSKVSNSNNDTVELTEQDINKLFTLSKDDIIKYLGNKYEIVDDDELIQNGYFFKKYLLTITFDDNNLINAIFCGDKVTVKGAKKGMNFASVMKILGKTTIEKMIFISDDAFRISYENTQYIVTFTSYENTGEDSMLIIYNAK